MYEQTYTYVYVFVHVQVCKRSTGTIGLQRLVGNQRQPERRRRQR